MSNKSWLLLTEYSNKYHVSISTLRRRIKEDSIEYRLSHGKYFLIDEPLSHKTRGRPIAAESYGHNFFQEGSEIGSAVYFENDDVISLSSTLTPSTSNSNDQAATAAKMYEELKRTYTQILQQKEEQILQLREEVSDLRTLVQVLETENMRLNKA